MNSESHINGIPLENIKCKNGYNSRMVCINPQCKLPAFLCMKKQCQKCSELHTECRSYWLQTLASKINKKKLQISDSTMSGFEQILNKLEGIKAKVDKQAASVKKIMQYYGFSSKQTELVQKIQCGKYDSIHGWEIKDFLKDLKIHKRMRATKQQVESLWVRIQKSLDMAFARFYDDLENVQPYIPSSIVDDFDTKIWQQNFKKKVKSYELVYSASKSKFNVETFFHRVSKHSSTLIVAKTQDNKIFGGFSKIKWTKKRSSDNGQGFIFSVRDKQVFKTGQHGSYNTISAQNYAPCFGNQQFFINNDSINNCKSIFKPGLEYGQTMSQSQLEKITGSKTGQINIVNWQVFSVLFMK